MDPSYYSPLLQQPEISTAKMKCTAGPTQLLGELFPSRFDVNVEVVPRLRICIFPHEILTDAPQRECDYGGRYCRGFFLCKSVVETVFTLFCVW